jgi:hypothetical protein
MYFSYLAACRDGGLAPRKVVQTIGNAKASAGYHARDGYVTVKGKREPYCAAIDISVFRRADDTPDALSESRIRALLEALARHGYAGWYRYRGAFAENRHIHAVFVNHAMKPQLRAQVRDFLHDRDGLAAHGPEPFFTASKAMDDLLRAAFLEANPP